MERANAPNAGAGKKKTKAEQAQGQGQENNKPSRRTMMMMNGCFIPLPYPLILADLRPSGD